LHRASLLVCSSLALASLVASLPARATTESDDLVQRAREHEAAHDDYLAARRYTEAIEIDSRNAAAYLGLAEVRMRLGEAHAAEIVYTAALRHLPLLHQALRGRSRARWAQGRHDEAETDLASFATMENDAAAWRDLAKWFGDDGQTPAQLATWRKIFAMATARGDEAAVREARAMVRALQMLVGPADPASSPAGDDPTRDALARIARRGG
jgi:tetratricopeptide (TPR) repeat protein